MMARGEQITTEMLIVRNKYLVRIAELTGIPVDDIMSRSKTDKVSQARCYLAWALTTLEGYTTTQAGVLIRRNHDSVIYQRRKLTTAKRLSAEVTKIMDNLKELNRKGMNDKELEHAYHMETCPYERMRIARQIKNKKLSARLLHEANVMRHSEEDGEW